MKTYFALLAGLLRLAEAGSSQRSLVNTRSHKRAQRLPPQCSYGDDKTCYFLLYFSGSKFCSSSNVQCQEVQPDGHCRLTGGVYTKMESSGSGYKIESSSDSDCSCYNGVATYSGKADSNEGVSGFSASCQDGVKLVTGKWCKPGLGDPSYACAVGGKFTKRIEALCGGSYDFDVLNGDMCNKVGFHLKGSKIISNGPLANASRTAPAKESAPRRSAAGHRGSWVLPVLLAVALLSLQAP